MSRRGAPTSAVLLAAFGVVAACDGGCGPRAAVPTTTVAAGSIVVVDSPAPVAEGAAMTPRRGMGWYPNIEVDAASALHLAWVDADAGDVRYAVTVAGGSAIEGEPVVVDSLGAVGSFLRLTLGPGGAPLLSYSRQDTGIFRFAWRPMDRARIRDAGGAADDAIFPAYPPTTTTGTPVSLQAGFIGEEVGYGDQVGRGSSLTVDRDGRVAIAYYSADDRLRLARRPADVAAFGVDSAGVFEKRDLDAWARGSTRVVSDTVVLDDGTVVVAYAHDVATDARLRVAILPPTLPATTATPGAPSRPTTIEDRRGPTVTLDGLTSRIVPRRGADGSFSGIVDVIAHDKNAAAIVLRSVDVNKRAWLDNRTRLADVDGVAVTVARPNGAGWFAIARVREEGLFLYEIAAGPAAEDGSPTSSSVSRVELEGPSMQNDGWLDVVARGDGRPAAVWFSTTDAVLKLYAP